MEKPLEDNTPDDEESMLWPKLGMKIFLDPTEMHSAACIDYGPRSPRYAAGFVEAAQHLANHMIESGNDLDILVYPMLHNFRHGIELQLKALIPACRVWQRLGEPSGKKATHDLGKLWEEVEPVLRAVDSEGKGRETLHAVDVLLRELHETDPTGETFRYATLRGGRDSFPRKYLDVPHAALTLTALSTFLSAAHDHIDREIEMRAEYEQFLSDQMPSENE